MARVKHLRLEGALSLVGSANFQQPAEIAARGVERAAARLQEGGDLGGFRLQQAGVEVLGVNLENLPLVAGAEQEFSVAVKRQGVDDLLFGGPKLPRFPVREDPIDFCAAGYRRGRRSAQTGHRSGGGYHLGLRRRGSRRRRRLLLLVAHRCRVNTAVGANGHCRDFLLGRLVQDEAFP